MWNPETLIPSVTQNGLLCNTPTLRTSSIDCICISSAQHVHIVQTDPWKRLDAACIERLPDYCNQARKKKMARTRRTVLVTHDTRQHDSQKRTPKWARCLLVTFGCSRTTCVHKLRGLGHISEGGPRRDETDGLNETVHNWHPSGSSVRSKLVDWAPESRKRKWALVEKENKPKKDKKL